MRVEDSQQTYDTNICNSGFGPAGVRRGVGRDDQHHFDRERHRVAWRERARALRHGNSHRHRQRYIQRRVLRWRLVTEPVQAAFTITLTAGGHDDRHPFGSRIVLLGAASSGTAHGSATVTGGTGTYAGATGSFPSLTGTVPVHCWYRLYPHELHWRRHDHHRRNPARGRTHHHGRPGCGQQHAEHRARQHLHRQGHHSFGQRVHSVRAAASHAFQRRQGHLHAGCGRHRHRRVSGLPLQPKRREPDRLHPAFHRGGRQLQRDRHQRHASAHRSSPRWWPTSSPSSRRIPPAAAWRRSRTTFPRAWWI